MAAKARHRGNGAFEIHRRSRLQVSERGTVQGLTRHVGGKRIFVHVECGQADAVDSDRIAFVHVFGNQAGGDHDARIFAARGSTARTRPSSSMMPVNMK